MELQLLPMSAETAAQLVNGETGEITAIQYLVGHPRTYRFDASRGFFSLNGIMPISKKEQAVTIIPIAYRIFKADILGVKGKQWVELFFLNGRNQVCSLLMHGYSVDSLLESTTDLFYDDVNLCGVALTIQPIGKTSKQQDENGKYPKYFIGKFSYQLLDEVAKENLQAATKDLQIWRADTVTTEVETQVAVNYQAPVVDQALVEGEEIAEITEDSEVSATTAETSTSTAKKSKRGKRKEVAVG